MSQSIGMISLGCAKNQVNAEQMLFLLRVAGYEILPDPDGADLVIINTCGFIEDAKAEAIDNILAMGEMKKEGRIGKILVTGCLAQRYQMEIVQEMPEVDGVLGTGSYYDIVSAVGKVLAGELVSEFGDINAPQPEPQRILTTPEHYAYLRIAEGCDNHCAFCIIPQLRGRYRSRPMLCAIDGFVWVRVHYLYPDEMSEELIDVLANEPKIVKYLDIPIQHINDNILRAMNRRGNGEYVKQLLKKLRARIPGLVIRTSLITGLPGEGEEEFQQLCEFLKEFKLERAGTFAFSPEEGTKAALMEYPDKEVAQERAEIIGELQSRIMDEYNASCEGKIMQVLCDGYDPDEDCYYGRTYADSPDIDGRIWFTSSRHVKTGEFVNVCVVGAYDGELTGMLEEDMEDNDDGE